MNFRHIIQAVVLLLGITPLAVAQNQVPALQPREVPTPTPLPQDANQYVRLAIDHELVEQERDHTHWRYSLHREDNKGSQDRDVIETTEGSLSRTLLKWGRPLNAEEREADDARMQKQISDPEERSKHAKREKKDAEKARQMLHSIPEAFIFSYEGEQDGQVRLTFVPNPHFDPSSMELKVFRSLRGRLWIDRNSTRLAAMDGELFEDVNFGWGLLGHLNKGGTFKVARRDVGAGNWEIISEEINMNGRAAIFKTIMEKQKQALSDFRRVPDSLTLTQAYDLLSKGPNPLAVVNDHAQVRRPQGKD
jgi:hypothetical protein